MGDILWCQHRFDPDLRNLERESLIELNFWLDEAGPEAWSGRDASVIEIEHTPMGVMVTHRPRYPLDPLSD